MCRAPRRTICPDAHSPVSLSTTTGTQLVAGVIVTNRVLAGGVGRRMVTDNVLARRDSSSRKRQIAIAAGVSSDVSRPTGRQGDMLPFPARDARLPSPALRRAGDRVLRRAGWRKAPPPARRRSFPPAAARRARRPSARSSASELSNGGMPRRREIRALEPHAVFSRITRAPGAS